MTLAIDEVTVDKILCGRLGLDAPIIQAPMNWATDAGLVAAVSAAGGLGTLGPNAGQKMPESDPDAAAERLREQIHAVRAVTGRPFAVNVPIGRGAGRAFSDATVRVMIAEKVPVAIVVTGSPEIYTVALKEAGVFTMHAVASVRHARKAEACGVDAVVAEGFEGGGHSGFAELPMTVLVNQVVRAVHVPVVAAGGISDGRGLLQGLSAGAQAISMGTRFMACTESPIHGTVKDALVRADDVATVSWGRTTEIARTLDNAFSRRFRAAELSGATPDALHRLIADYPAGPNRRVGGLLHGDLEEGEIYAGAGVGLIDAVLPARTIIERTMQEAREALAELGRALDGPG